MPLIFKGQHDHQRYRTWGAIGAAAVGVVGSAVMSDSGSKSGGGAGTQTSTKEPWLAAQPWIKQNMAQGQAMQDRYTAQPFSPQQNAAYANQYAQSDYMRNLVPSLLGQMSQQPVGYDPNNPSARASPWNWQALAGGAGAPNLNQQSVANAVAPPAPPPGPDPMAGKFRNQGEFAPIDQYNAILNQVHGGNYPGMARGAEYQPAAMSGSGGGYGKFNYGDQPEVGSQGYRDMREYQLFGGADPLNLYTK